MLRLIRPTLVAFALLLAAMPARAGAQEFTIIVNAANPASSVSKDEAAMLFLKQKLTWGNGQKVSPVDLGKAHPTRAAFSKQVLGRTVQGVHAFWQGQIFAGGAQPPLEKASDADVVAFVRATPNAVGYVPAGTPLPEGVKAIALK